MPNYQRPGVFVEESLTPLSATIPAPGASVAAFVGLHTKGPTVPTLVESWQQFVAAYGGFPTDVTQQLAQSVYAFFNNGGRRCYIVRAANTNAVAALVSLNDTGATLPLLILTALAPGLGGNSIYITTAKVDPAQAGATDLTFNLYVHNGGSTAAYITERFMDLSMNPADVRYAPTIINSPTIGSALVKASHAGSQVYTLARARPVEVAGTPLLTGSDGTGTPDLVGAAAQLEDLNVAMTLNAPGVTDTTTLGSLTTWAEGTGRTFLVCDVPVASATVAATVTAYSAIPTALGKSSYAALYGPWLYVADPSSSVKGAVRLVPPGGAVMGIMTTTDATRGVQKSPAGLDVPLNGVLGMEMTFKNTDLDTLNVKQVNIIRSMAGAGYCIMGARTCFTGTTARYVAIRRTLIYIKTALLDGTRWAIFEPNNDDLWSTLSATIADYLTGLMQTGVLAGTSPAQAYYVKCDDDTNPPAAVAAGEVHVEVGVALNSPAEFVVIKIGQFQGSGNVSDDLGE